MIKKKRKGNAHRENDNKPGTLTEVSNKKESEVNNHNQNLSRHHIRHDRADKEAFFTLENCGARRAAVFDIKTPFDDRGPAAGRTAQLETSPQGKNDRARTFSHSGQSPSTA